MKYLVMLGDGMADYPCDEIGGKTPLEAADKPTMNYLSAHGTVGKCLTVPPEMVPESDTANLAVMGYDPLIYSKGRSPLEAVSIGLEMTPEQTAFRCNLVTLSEGDCKYEDRIMLDHSSGDITTDEADELIKTLEKELGNELRHFYTGISYRHCLLWANAPGSDVNERIYDFSRPHDIINRCIKDYLPAGDVGDKYRVLFEKSYDILENHPVNISRRSRGLNPANSLWLWSPGKKPALANFNRRFGLNAAVISAVDLIKGIGICAGMNSIDVEGATGTLNTNYAGKAQAAVDAFKNGSDFVYVHVEGPDECGHHGELKEKIEAIQNIDKLILKHVKDYLDSTGEHYRILLMPDHPTPVSRRTHTHEPVPFVIFDNQEPLDSGIENYCEKTAETTGLYIDPGYKLIDSFIIK